MARLSFDSLNYSRTAGMFTVSGKGYLEIALKLRDVDGIDGIEHDVDNSEYVCTFNKEFHDKDKIKEIFKSVKLSVA